MFGGVAQAVHRTVGTLEFLPRSHFKRSFAGIVGDEKIHRDVLAVHVFVNLRWMKISNQYTAAREIPRVNSRSLRSTHPSSNVSRHGGGVEVRVVLMIEGGASEHHGNFVHPLGIVSPSRHVRIPRVKTSGKTDEPIRMLAPEKSIQSVNADSDNTFK